jgi:hypothetical protein
LISLIHLFTLTNEQGAFADMLLKASSDIEAAPIQEKATLCQIFIDQVEKFKAWFGANLSQEMTDKLATIESNVQCGKFEESKLLLNGICDVSTQCTSPCFYLPCRHKFERLLVKKSLWNIARLVLLSSTYVATWTRYFPNLLK